MTKYQLFALLASPNANPITVKGVTGYLASIEREDGSGRSFILTLNTSRGKQNVWIRTLD